MLAWSLALAWSEGWAICTPFTWQLGLHHTLHCSCCENRVFHWCLIRFPPVASQSHMDFKTGPWLQTQQEYTRRGGMERFSDLHLVAMLVRLDKLLILSDNICSYETLADSPCLTQSCCHQCQWWWSHQTQSKNAAELCGGHTKCMDTTQSVSLSTWNPALVHEA